MTKENQNVEKYLTNGRYDAIKSAKIAQVYKEQHQIKGVNVVINKNNMHHNSNRFFQKIFK